LYCDALQELIDAAQREHVVESKRFALSALLWVEEISINIFLNPNPPSMKSAGKRMPRTRRIANEESVARTLFKAPDSGNTATRFAADDFCDRKGNHKEP